MRLGSRAERHPSRRRRFRSAEASEGRSIGEEVGGSDREHCMDCGVTRYGRLVKTRRFFFYLVAFIALTIYNLCFTSYHLN